MNKKLEKRIRLKKKIRTKITGTALSPRLSVFRSNQYIYAQIINDATGKTIVASSDLPRKASKSTDKTTHKTAKTEKKALIGTKIDKAKAVGTEVAQLATAQKITIVVFDRNGFKYTGRIKALADAARAAGLVF